MHKVDTCTTSISNSKQCYVFDNIAYYKVVSRKATYYIKTSDYESVTLNQSAIILYEQTITGLTKIKSYIKSIEFSDILFIAPSITTNFNMFDLEKAS